MNAIPNDVNFTYQWADANGDIASATSSTFNASATGNYFVKAKSSLYPGCPEVQSDHASIVLATAPVVAFDSPSETCKDSPTNFKNQSTVDANAAAAFAWDFGDTGTSTNENATHTYTTLGDLTVKLTVTYRGNACSTPLTKPIKISLAPTVAITAPDNIFQMCDGDKLTLSVTPDFTEYSWSTSATTPTIDVTEGGSYSVQVKNAIGCKITANAFVTALPAPQVDVTAEKNPINVGENTKLAATTGYSSYEWTPIEGLDNPASETPIATPTITTTYTVKVVGANGCPGTGTFELTVIADDPLNLLKISNFFSPNGDATNPTWRVDPEVITQTCGVSIFDEKGMKVYEAKPYLNDWDGTNNGKSLPNGGVLLYYKV
ncbi:MAG: PKD domain-containing protein [Bacteroidota bacterium]